MEWSYINVKEVGWAMRIDNVLSSLIGIGKEYDSRIEVSWMEFNLGLTRRFDSHV